MTITHFSRAVVRKLAREAGLSDRRFIDVFRFEAGLKPRLFYRVRRFQRVLAMVHGIPAPDWAQLALDHGYFDQSHLIRDFLAFSGFSPADYLRRLNDLRQQCLHVKFNHLPLAGSPGKSRPAPQGTIALSQWHRARAWRIRNLVG